MASQQVQPLHIAKGSNTPRSSPTKNSGSLPRPLSEISPAERRRNSPSWFQASPTKSPTKKQVLSNDSSPFQSSPAEPLSSPRQFWHSRNAENVPYGERNTSPSPQRRSSIERLQRASRVKNSNILALEQKQEYDPTRIPQIERPLAKVQPSAFGSPPVLPDLKRSDSTKLSFSMMSPGKLTEIEPKTAPAPTRAASKDTHSPTKSALSPSKFKDSFDPATGTWSAHTSYHEDDFVGSRSSHRHVKSVTFDAAPPQVNEYETTTPDISSLGTNSREGSYDSIDDEDLDGPFDLGHIDHDDSFDASLEDTAKTPVVGPDDWSAESQPAYHNANQNRYEGSPLPDRTPTKAVTGRSPNATPEPIRSSAEQRPLPAIPAGHVSPTKAASPGLSSTAERMLHSPQRNLPTPPPASASKSDIQNFGSSKMPLEERLKLMMMSDDAENSKSAAEQQRERRMRRAGARDRTGSPQVETQEVEVAEDDEPHLEDEDTIADMSILGDFQISSKISRESIMRRVNGNKTFERQSDYNFSPAGSPSPKRSPAKSPQRQQAALDPDVPIPSTEDSMFDDTTTKEEDESVIISRDSYQDDVFEMYQDDDAAEEEQHAPTASHDHGLPHAVSTEGLVVEKTAEEMPRPNLEPKMEVPPLNTNLPAALSTSKRPMSDELKSCMSSPEAPKSTEAATKELEKQVAEVKTPTTPERRLSKPEYDGTGWGEDDEYDEEDSVIHHDVDDDDEFIEEESPTIPEQMATIKSASGSKLKTRVSNTPADIAAMREARRQVSHEVPAVPPIPQKHVNRLSRDASMLQEDGLGRHPSFKDKGLTLDFDAGLSLDQDFERVIEGQKRGYLMRQNTKLVAASDKDGEEKKASRSVNNSPIKGSERPHSWVVEPWNGQVRRKSTRSRPDTKGAVPPLPGHESNALTATTMADDDLSGEAGVLDGNERGRLFVKVMGVKDLDLPLPKGERTWFSLTLDNGVHCVTTSWLELARNAPIGQEFELVVPNELEFQLTLNVKLEKPAYLNTLQQNGGKPGKTKTSTFSKVFASPKKRKEIEIRQREEERLAQEHRNALARKRNGTPSGYELLSPLVAEDGSFGRSYICLKEHEQRCYGRPYMAEIACFNEWASEEEGFAQSVKSKRGDAAMVRRAPYKVGKLELQLLFVPRPKNVTDDDMPKSMNSCVRELKAAEEKNSRSHEGHLSQQGGDCPYWRRRYFKLVGPRLTAYHEATRQPRATINLGNAKKLIDDRRALTEKDMMGKGGRRRRSAFAEEEEGYMFVEEGFRIRFNNGEVIDFYADTAEDKEDWMRILSDMIGRGTSESGDDGLSRSKTKWCELVLKKEEQQRKKSESGRRSNSNSNSNSGTRHSRTKSAFS